MIKCKAFSRSSGQFLLIYSKLQVISPPAADSDSSSSEDEDNHKELNQPLHFVAPSTDGLAPSSDSAIAQKCVHLSSSSDSEKEGSPVEDLNLQVVIAHPPQNGWVEVKKGKGKSFVLNPLPFQGSFQRFFRFLYFAVVLSLLVLCCSSLLASLLLRTEIDSPIISCCRHPASVKCILLYNIFT